MGLVFGAIAPHGSIAVGEWCTPEQRPLAAKTRAGFEQLAKRFDAAKPDVTVVFTPHHVHLEKHMAIITSGTLHGVLEGGATRVELKVKTDRDLMLQVQRAISDAGVPLIGVSYGGNDPATATMPVDWATQIPLHFMGRERVPAVVLAPARDLSWDMHVTAGRAIAKAAAASGKRVAVIASCDHGHGHDPKGPYGFTPKSKEFDDKVVDIVKRGALGELLRFDAPFPTDAKADSFWQMLMLHGTLGDGWRSEFLSYEAPTYFGMLCASFTPPD